MSRGGCPVPRPRSSCRPEAPQLAACLNEQLFTDLTDARSTIETWRRRHAELRLHSALRYAAPTVVARRAAARRRGFHHVVQVSFQPGGRT
jgi:hypothetical protein